MPESMSSWGELMAPAESMTSLLALRENTEADTGTMRHQNRSEVREILTSAVLSKVDSAEGRSSVMDPRLDELRDSRVHQDVKIGPRRYRVNIGHG